MKLPEIKTLARSASLFAAALLGAITLVPPSMAAAPMVKTQAPGYYPLMVGQFQVAALLDGSLNLPVEKLLKQPAQKTTAALAKQYLKSPVETSINAYLVNTGKRLMLFDVGSSGSHGPTTGAVLANLKALGYKPEDVDDVFITHSHWDHVEGLTRDGQKVFPNAVVHVGKGDVDFFLGHQAKPNESHEEREGFEVAAAAYGPYQADGRLKPIDGPGVVAEGVTAVPSPGHTPGHTSYIVESEGKKLYILGDLIHVAAVQFDDPTVTIVWDSDPRAAVVARQKLFAEAASAGALVAAAHLSFPGFGTLHAKGKGWVYRRSVPPWD
ncbi:MBL fold metallo-hydrolase [Roseateles noduli]|uniref:MBL fold metallo-hydrolase n=1 Tax=Roseateles noduli TaxID=2052484 RepID=UPI003D64F5B5